MIETIQKQYINKNELGDANLIQCWMIKIKEYVKP